MGTACHILGFDCGLCQQKNSSGRGLVLSMIPVPCQCLSSGSYRNKGRPYTMPLSFVQMLQEEMETPVPCHCLLSGSHRNKGRPYTMSLSFVQILQKEMETPVPCHFFCLDLTWIKGDPTPCYCLLSGSYREKGKGSEFFTKYTKHTKDCFFLSLRSWSET